MKWSVSLIGLLLAAGLAVAETQTKEIVQPDTERILLKVEDEWAQVDVHMDKTVLARIWAPEYMNTDRSGEITNGREANIAAFAYDGVTKATNVDMRVHVFAENVAVVTGMDRTEGRGKDGKPFLHEDRFTDTYVKRGGAWQCVASQVTRIK